MCLNAMKSYVYDMEAKKKESKKKRRTSSVGWGGGMLLISFVPLVRLLGLDDFIKGIDSA